MSTFMSSSINRRQENEFESELESELEIEVIVIIKSRKYHIDERDDYIKERIRSWSRSNFKNENLWERFRHDFADWNEVRFRLTTQKAQRELRAYLRLHDVWVRREREIVITKTLANTMKKKTQTSWTEKEIMINIESFDSEVIRHLRETNFERNSRDYSWQASSRSESRRASSRQSSRSRESSFRDRSVEERALHLEKRAFHQASVRQLSRESSITRNFLRQSSSSSSRSEIQKISQSSSSEISEILQNLYNRQSHSSENLYSDSSSQSENFYIRQSKKKSMLRQSFQSSRFSKFYQSSQLSKQFYRRSTEHSSLVSSSSFVSLQSFASSLSSVNQSIKSSEYDRELVNLTKLYSDEAKYNEKNDNFSFKLIMFNDMCDRIDVLFEAKLKAFLTMLKKLALNYYYANITSKDHSITFDDVCVSMMNYFEDAEYKRSILNKWNNLSLKSVMSKTENEEKSMNECLQLLIKELRHLQHDLQSILRIDDFIHNKLVNACQKISACQYAYFKSSEILTELINDLKSSITTYQKAHFIEFIFFIDRRYHENFQSRINQNREQRREYQNRRNQNQRRTEKKCFVCHKEECWSIRHSRDEREDAKQKFRNRFSDQMNKRINQYIAEYEGLDSNNKNDEDLNPDLENEMKALMIEFLSFSFLEKNENAETFIIIFESMKNFELMTTDLVNRSFSHYFIDFHTDMNDRLLNDQNLVHLQISLKNEFSIAISHIIIVHTDMK